MAAEPPPFIPQTHPVPLIRFSESANQWQSFEHPSRASSEQYNVKKIKLLSYNIYFGPSGPTNPTPTDVQRWIGVLELVEKESPDVIGFQEVTPTALDLIFQNPFIRKNYHISTLHPSSVSPYGCVMMSRLETFETFWMTLPSVQGRYLVGMRLRLGRDDICTIGTVHFESVFDFNGPTMRAHQMRCIIPELERRVIGGNLVLSALMGDFNVQSERREPTPPHFTDVWSALHPGEVGYTFDGRENPKLVRSAQQDRLDRLIMFSENNKWVPSHIEISGKECLRTVATPPSDHYCIIATLEITS